MKKFLKKEVFSYFVKMLLGCCLHSYNDIYLTVTLKCRQANFVASVSSPLFADTSDKLSSVLLLLVIN
jgi:hypothetical protein